MKFPKKVLRKIEKDFNNLVNGKVIRVPIRQPTIYAKIKINWEEDNYATLSYDTLGDIQDLDTIIVKRTKSKVNQYTKIINKFIKDTDKLCDKYKVDRDRLWRHLTISTDSSLCL